MMFHPHQVGTPTEATEAACLVMAMVTAFYDDVRTHPPSSKAAASHPTGACVQALVCIICVHHLVSEEHGHRQQAGGNGAALSGGGWGWQEEGCRQGAAPTCLTNLVREVHTIAATLCSLNAVRVISGVFEYPDFFVFQECGPDEEMASYSMLDIWPAYKQVPFAAGSGTAEPSEKFCQSTAPRSPTHPHPQPPTHTNTHAGRCLSGAGEQGRVPLTSPGQARHCSRPSQAVPAISCWSRRLDFCRRLPRPRQTQWPRTSRRTGRRRSSPPLVLLCASSVRAYICVPTALLHCSALPSISLLLALSPSAFLPFVAASTLIVAHSLHPSSASSVRPPGHCFAYGASGGTALGPPAVKVAFPLDPPKEKDLPAWWVLLLPCMLCLPCLLCCVQQPCGALWRQRPFYLYYFDRPLSVTCGSWVVRILLQDRDRVCLRQRRARPPDANSAGPAVPSRGSRARAAVALDGGGRLCVLV